MTTKQQIVVREIVGNGGSMADAMRKAGYSKAMIDNPQRVTRSLAFREVMEEFGITDGRLAEILNDGLSATDEGEPDYDVRHKYLTTALKLKGHERVTPPNITVIPIYGGMSGAPDEVSLPRHDIDAEDIQAQATH